MYKDIRDMDSTTDKIARILPKALVELLGGKRVTEDALVSTPHSKATPQYRFTKTERSAFFKNTYVQPKNYGTAESDRLKLDPKSLISMFQPIHEQVGTFLKDMEKLEELAPEINQAKAIRVSSILSPNDLQSNTIQISIPNIPGLDAEVLAEVSKYLNEFFNTTLELEDKLDIWVKRALYEVGSTPILTMPVGVVSTLRNTNVVGYTPEGGQTVTTGSSESFDISVDDVSCDDPMYMTVDEYYTDTTKNTIWNSKVLTDTNDKLKPGTESYTHSLVSSLPVTDILATLKQQFPEHYTGFEIDTEIKTALETLQVKVTKELNEGDVLKMSENPEIVKFSQERKKLNKARIDEMYRRHEQSGTTITYLPEYFIDLDTVDTDTAYMSPYGFYMVLPSESVIPIISKHDPTDHLGYFVLVDIDGTPLTYQESGISGDVFSSTSGLVQSAHSAMFGSSMFNISSNKISDRMKRDVFNTILDNIISKRLTSMTHTDCTVKDINNISAVMFQRMLEKKQTGLVYVPNRYMTYLCFDYNENGTGRSILSKVQFILALRTTFVVASIMAMANDAISHTNINVTFDDKITNYEQILDIIKNQFIEKRRMKLSMDPTDITRDIARNALTISPKNMAGIQGFEIEPVTQSHQSVKADTELLSALDTMLVTALGVPYAALNQLSETEYARSVVTNNLFFSKQIIKDQKCLCGYLEAYCKKMMMFSPRVQSDIAKIVSSSTKVRSQVVDKAGTGRTNASKIVQRIISKIKVKLPTPALAPDKAQFNEFTEYVRIIDDLSNIIFNAEIAPTDDTVAQNTLNYLRSVWKKDASLKLIENIGYLNNIDIPTMGDMALSQNEWSDHLQALYNFAALLKRTRDSFSSDESGGGYDSMGGGGDEFGSGGEGGDEFSDDMGGDEFSDDTSGEEVPTEGDDETGIGGGMDEEPSTDSETPTEEETL